MAWKPCAVDTCTRQAVSRGWCHGHYQRWVRLGDVLPDRALGRQVNFACSIAGCDRDAISRGLCRTHYRRHLATGDAQADKPVREVAGTGYVSHGYRIVPVPKHLRHLTNGHTPIAEHRLVMARLLGRPMTADESVHHKDGDRLNNAEDNLELWSRWQPRGQRVSDKVAYALELLARYMPEALAERLL
jgi:hypothetical protein